MHLGRPSYGYLTADGSERHEGSHQSILESRGYGRSTDGLTKDLDAQLQAATAIYTELIKPWRNRRLGHNDLEALKNKKSLPDIPYDQIRDLVDLINKIARGIALTIREVDQSFVPVVGGSDWAARLFLVLEAGVERCRR
jgi:hypothetical protein